jgi:hypothetical protein
MIIISIDNQIEPVSIGLEKYDGLTSSAPEKYGCGLAVDIHYIPDISTGNKIAPIQLSCCIIIRNTTLSTLSYPECCSSVAELVLHISTTVNIGYNNMQ